MKKEVFAVAVVLSVCTDVFALQASQGPVLKLGEGNGYSICARAGILIQEGEARELVYDGNHQMSELKWDISNLTMAGGSLSAAIGGAFQLNAGVWVSLNKGNGLMQDYDWYIDGADWTHFSDGDVEINSAYTFDLNGSCTFLRSNGFELYGILGYKRFSWDWSEYGRTYIYSVNGWRDYRGDAGGENGIDYKQTFDVPYAGLGARLDYGRISGSAYMLYSPFVQAEDFDHHIMRNIHFKETFENIDYVGIGGEVTAKLNDVFFVSLSMDMHGIPEARGDMSLLDENGTQHYLPDAAGIENTVVSMSLMAGFLL